MVSRYIEAMEEYKKEDGDRSIFLAGGIIGCGDWQSKMTDFLSGSGLVILNPRRNDFPDKEVEPYATTHQIKWEFDHLRKADMILFWFPKEGQCMTSLYELGTWSNTNKPLFVGIEPGYVKEKGLTTQLALVRPHMPIARSLADLSSLVWRDVKEKRKSKYEDV